MNLEVMLPNIIADFDNSAELTPELILSRRERILELERAFSQLDHAYEMEEFNEGKVTHHFATGVYGRELFIPAGNVIVSKIHRAKTFNVIAKGVISVICPHKGYNTYSAPHTFVSEPFTKRVVIAHEDTLWITSHGYSGEHDLDKVEDAIIAKDFSEEYLSGGRTFQDVLLAFNSTEEVFTTISNNTSDMIDFPSDTVGVSVKDSQIAGKGLFAEINFSEGDVICLARIGNFRTPAGKYSNHSPEPNAKMVMLDNGDVNVVAIKSILSGEEIVTDYVLNYINTRRIE